MCRSAPQCSKLMQVGLLAKNRKSDFLSDGKCLYILSLSFVTHKF
jgi:hypothetical protein